MIGIMNKMCHNSIIGKLEEATGLKIKEKEFYNSYFLFEGIENSKSWFVFDGLDDFEFAIWINNSRMRKGCHHTYSSIQFFGEFTEFIDKFKPSRTYFSIEGNESIIAEKGIDFIKHLINNKKYHFLNNRLNWYYGNKLEYEDLVNDLGDSYDSAGFNYFDDLVNQSYNKYFTDKKEEEEKEQQKILEFEELCCELSKDERIVSIAIAKQNISYPNFHIALEYIEYLDIEDIKDKIRWFKFHSYKNSAYIEHFTSIEEEEVENEYHEDYFRYLKSKVFKKDSFYEYDKIKIYHKGIMKEFSV
jgi:hypothetical protein